MERVPDLFHKVSSCRVSLLMGCATAADAVQVSDDVSVG